MLYWESRGAFVTSRELLLIEAALTQETEGSPFWRVYVNNLECSNLFWSGERFHRACPVENGFTQDLASQHGFSTIHGGTCSRDLDVTCSVKTPAFYVHDGSWLLRFGLAIALRGSGYPHFARTAFTPLGRAVALSVPFT